MCLKQRLVRYRGRESQDFSTEGRGPSLGNRKFLIHTPFVTKLQPGKYPITMTLAGYAEWKRETTVKAGKPSAVVAQLERKQ